MREPRTREEYFAQKVEAARKVLEALHRGERTGVKGFTLERRAFVHGNPEHGAIAQATPPRGVDWVVNSPHPTAEPFIVTIFPRIGDLNALVEHAGDLVFGGFGSPGIDLSGSVGTVSAKIVRPESRRPFVFIDHAQSGYRTTKDYDEFTWDGNHLVQSPSMRESFPRKLATRYAGWRLHAFGHLFGQTEQGGELDDINRIVLQRTHSSSGEELGQTNKDFFARAAEAHGFRVRVSPHRVYAIRPRSVRGR